jgi:hypothetical protein
VKWWEQQLDNKWRLVEGSAWVQRLGDESDECHQDWVLFPQHTCPMKAK